jgi:hypothetical protein
MKKVFSQTVERYFYENEKERIKHVEEMKAKGWEVSSQEKKFVGDLYLDDIEDEKNYRWFAEFYKKNKNDRNSNKKDWLEGLFLAAIDNVRIQPKDKQQDLASKISSHFANIIIIEQFDNEFSIKY